MTWRILVNGRPVREGILDATEYGGGLLDEGHTAVEVVESTIKRLEDNPSFDAGTGCDINLFGDILMDASIMDGRNLRAGAVGAVSKIKNPISIARKVMEHTPNVLLVGGYAKKFASLMAEKDNSIILNYDAGIPKTKSHFNAVREMISREIPAEESNEEDALYRFLISGKYDKIREKLSSKESGTVSVTALDKGGNYAAGSSTGGWSFSLPGRIGDSPLIGCGAYADNDIGAASTSGIRGEENIRLGGLTRKICDLMAAGSSAQDATEKVTDYSRKRLGLILRRGSLIAIDKKGNPGINNAHIAPSQGVGLMKSGMKTPIFLI